MTKTTFRNVLKRWTHKNELPCGCVIHVYFSFSNELGITDADTSIEYCLIHEFGEKVRELVFANTVLTDLGISPVLNDVE